MATPSELKTRFKESEFELRTPDSHKEQCTILNSKTGSSRDAYSKETGINHESILNELQYFSVASGALVPDVMHDVLEGVLQYEVKLLLRHLIYDEHCFTLDQLNSSDCTLASQMWLLARLLPLAIGAKVSGDNEW